MDPQHPIPKHEHDNVLSVYWAMLTTLESSIDPRSSAIDRMTVEAGYTVLNRIGFTKNRPRWEDMRPKA